MKKVLYLIGLTTILYSCSKKDTSATYVARVLTANEKFNDSAPDSVLKIYDDKGNEKSADSNNLLTVKFRDTVVNIKASTGDTSIHNKFTSAEFVNTQKTALLVQSAGKSGSEAPFFIIAFKDGKLNVVSLDRPSNGKKDKEFSKGSSRVGRNGYLINNDFFVANVNAKVFLIKRQHPEERIQGEFITNSPDRTTLAFLTEGAVSLYQVNYVSDEVLDQPIKADARNDVYRYIQKSFTWQPNAGGVYFFKPSN